jgi:hypothetical protein
MLLAKWTLNSLIKGISIKVIGNLDRDWKVEVVEYGEVVDHHYQVI